MFVAGQGLPFIMCGIAGLIGHGANTVRLVNAMLSVQVYRGPNSSGVWSAGEPNLVLGHRRLSILESIGINRGQTTIFYCFLHPFIVSVSLCQGDPEL